MDIAGVAEVTAGTPFLDVDQAATIRDHINEHGIRDVLEPGLAHRVTTAQAERSFTWELMRMLWADPRPQFDLCYFDGSHTWDGISLGALAIASRIP